MKLLSLLILFASSSLANAQDKISDRSLLLREFAPTTSEVLDQPFSGSIRVIWPKTKEGVKSEKVLLNFLRPADGHKGHSPIDTPHLATTEEGTSYWGAFALRSKLPETKKLTSFSSYGEILDLLGPPTHLPFSGETDAKWAYDMVSWRLFSPIDEDSINLLQVSVFRKSSLGDDRNDRYMIESYSVSRGTLTKSEQDAAEQPATAGESK